MSLITLGQYLPCMSLKTVLALVSLSSFILQFGLDVLTLAFLFFSLSDFEVILQIYVHIDLFFSISHIHWSFAFWDYIFISSNSVSFLISYFYMPFLLLIYSCVSLCIVNILTLFFPLLILITEVSVGLHWLPCFPACSLAHGALFLSIFCTSWLWVHIAWIFICRNYLKPEFKTVFSREDLHLFPSHTGTTMNLDPL